MSSFQESPEYKMIAGNLAILYLNEAIEGTARSSLKENYQWIQSELCPLIY